MDSFQCQLYPLCTGRHWIRWVPVPPKKFLDCCAGITNVQGLSNSHPTDPNDSLLILSSPSSERSLVASCKSAMSVQGANSSTQQVQFSPALPIFLAIHDKRRWEKNYLSKLDEFYPHQNLKAVAKSSLENDDNAADDDNEMASPWEPWNWLPITSPCSSRFSWDNALLPSIALISSYLLFLNFCVGKNGQTVFAKELIC